MIHFNILHPRGSSTICLSHTHVSQQMDLNRNQITTIFKGLIFIQSTEMIDTRDMKELCTKTDTFRNYFELFVSDELSLLLVFTSDALSSVLLSLKDLSL